MAKRFFIIDGHAQIYRAYYAPFRDLQSPSGEPTRATYVFSQMLINLLRDQRPDYLAMVLDVSDATVFRVELDAAYKATREPPPEDLPPQMERIIGLVGAAGIPILRKQRFEADDLIATLVRRHAGAALDVVLVSKDKDLEQLLGPHVSLYDPNKGDFVTPESMRAAKGYGPELAVEAQILTGDTVDNVPGVKGIGPKTAAKLLEKYGSARGVIEHADELTPKQRENVLAFAPRIELTRELVTLRDDVEFAFELDAARVAGFDWAALQQVFGELGFRRLPEQLAEVTGAAPAERGADGDADDGGNDAAGAQKTTESAREHQTSPDAAKGADTSTDAAALAAKLAHPDGGDYECIDTLDKLADFARELAKQPAYAVDTETTSVSAIDAELVGLSFAWEVGRGYYIPVKGFMGSALPVDEVRKLLAPILANPKTLKVGHHLKYDLNVLHIAGMPVAGSLFDTMIAAFVVNPDFGSYKMDRIVERVFGHVMIPISDLIGKGRDQLTMDQAPIERVAEYAAEDADYTWRMREHYEPQIRGSDREALYYETEMPLVRVLTAMEREGVSIDADFLKKMSARLGERIEQIRDAVHQEIGRAFNLDSPKQLAEVLFDDLGFRVVRKTKTARSTDAATLETLARETEHAVPGLMMEYREIQKLLGTYVDALPATRARRTNRIHTSYHQTGAITGRLSSSEPNLQNIPIRTALGREIRRAFVPRTADERLIVADYSQVELRMLASFSEDEQLIRAFNDDRDIHAFVAAQINNVALEDVTKDMRARAKAVNFGIIYGQSAFGLAQGTGMSRAEAQQFIDDYFGRYPRIKAFIQQCIDDAKRDGFVRTVLGRRRPIPDIDSRNQTARSQAERLAINTVIQGSAADLIKIAMINLYKRIERERLPLRMLLQVHDELVCEGPAAEADALAEVLRETMSGAMTLKVPLKIDVAVGENWLEAK